MILTQLHKDIHEMSRQEKYRLIQFIVQDLEHGDRNKVKRVGHSPLEQQAIPKAQAIDIFVRKWKGFLKGTDTDTAKREYLEEKYR